MQYYGSCTNYSQERKLFNFSYSAGTKCGSTKGRGQLRNSKKRRVGERSNIGQKFEETIDLYDYCTVHWDGKLLKDFEPNKKVDRFAVVLSGSGEEWLLGFPKLSSGTSSG